MSKKPITVVISVGHMGKPHRPLDRGAVYHHVYESDLVLEYARIVYQELTIDGHYPFLVTHGTYGQRAAFANQIGADLYLDCHLNSSEIPPTTHYSLVEIAYWSSHVTRRFAQALSVKFGECLPVDKSDMRIIERDQRGWACINRVKAPALLLEPVFMNHPDGFREALSSAITIGTAISETIINFDW